MNHIIKVVNQISNIINNLIHNTRIFTRPKDDVLIIDLTLKFLEDASSDKVKLSDLIAEGLTLAEVVSRVVPEVKNSIDAIKVAQKLAAIYDILPHDGNINKSNKPPAPFI